MILIKVNLLIKQKILILFLYGVYFIDILIDWLILLMFAFKVLHLCYICINFRKWKAVKSHKEQWIALTSFRLGTCCPEESCNGFKINQPHIGLIQWDGMNVKNAFCAELKGHLHASMFIAIHIPALSYNNNHP